MGASSWSLGRIFGIEVRVHATWLLTFGLLTWGLAGGYFRFVSGAPLLLGAISALLLFGSVLVHELSHSLVAQARGMRVRDITLFIFGGVSNLGGQPRTARDEFLMAAAGPLTSFALAGLFWVATQAVGGTPTVGALFGSPRAVRTMSPPGAVLSYLAVVNLALGAFNLLPAFPLDGGRVFRSILWGLSHRYAKATVIASLVGQVFGFLLAGFGILRVVVFGDVVGGLWTMFIGWFLSQAAAASRRELRLRNTLHGVRVAEIMDRSPLVVEPELTVYQVVFDQLLRTGRRQVVVARDGRAIGVVDAETVNGVPRDRWYMMRVGELMRPIAFAATPDTDVAELLQRMDDRTTLVPVESEDRLVGVVDLAQILRYARLRQELQMPFSGRPARGQV